MVKIAFSLQKFVHKQKEAMEFMVFNYTFRVQIAIIY